MMPLNRVPGRSPSDAIPSRVSGVLRFLCLRGPPSWAVRMPIAGSWVAGAR